MKRACSAVLLGLLLMALVLGAVGVPSATAAAPAGYAPGSPAGSEYQEQLASARAIGAGDGAPARDAASEAGSVAASQRPAAAAPLFGVGVTTGDSGHRSRADAAVKPSGSGVKTSAATPANERAAIAAAARAPLGGPSSLLTTCLLLVAALLATSVLTLLLRRRPTRLPS